MMTATRMTIAEPLADRSVIKVGGSLFDWPELPRRLEAFLADRQASGDRLAVVCGGGPAADWVRTLDRVHHMGEERAHRLALRSLDFTAEAAMTLLPRPDWILADSVGQIEDAWRRGRLPLARPRAFLDDDERDRPEEALPHCWGVTTDSIAARLAVRLRARLWLLKSAPLDPHLPNREAAARAGLVDSAFPKIAQPLLSVFFLNLREETLIPRPF